MTGSRKGARKVVNGVIIRRLTILRSYECKCQRRPKKRASAPLGSDNLLFPSHDRLPFRSAYLVVYCLRLSPFPLPTSSLAHRGECTRRSFLRNSNCNRASRLGVACSAENLAAIRYSRFHHWSGSFHLDLRPVSRMIHRYLRT